MIEGWFDGVCEPKNPGGHAAWGALVKRDGMPENPASLGAREELPVEVAAHEFANLVSQSLRQRRFMTGENDLEGRVMAELPGR